MQARILSFLDMPSLVRLGSVSHGLAAATDVGSLASGLERADALIDRERPRPRLDVACERAGFFRVLLIDVRHRRE